MYLKHALPICVALFLAAVPLKAFGADAAISASNFVFSPADVTINVGDKVTWSGLQNGTHNVAQSSSAGSNVYDGSGFRSGAAGAVPSFEHTFATAGVFFYVCEPHAAGFGMKGSVTVQEVGDPDNLFVDFTAGSNGVGTEGSPFDNLSDAVSGANALGTINLEPGSSTETFTAGNEIVKALTLLNNTPGGGTVSVGDPGTRSKRSGGFKSQSELRER